MFGAGGGTSSYREVEDTDLIVLWGSNARETHPIFFHHVLQRRPQRRAPVRGRPAPDLVAPSGRTPGSGSTSAATSPWPTRSAREIIAAGLENREFIERATVDFEAYRAKVESYTLEYAERETGVPAEAIRELAHAFATAAAGDDLLDARHHRAPQRGRQRPRAHLLVLLTGHVGRYGSGVNPLRGQNNVQGGGDMGALPDRLPGFQHVENDALRAKFDAEWGVTVPPKRGWHLSGMFDAMERGDLTAVYCIGENPVQSEADQKRAIRLLEGLDFLVVQDLFLTKTAELADVVLPATAAWAESEGTVTNSERRVQRVRKAVEPPPGARDDLAIIFDLANRMGAGWGEADPETVWNEVRRLSPVHAGMSYARLEELGGIQWPCYDETHPGELFLHSRLWEDPVPGNRVPFVPVDHDPPVDKLDARLPDPADDRTPPRLVQHRRPDGRLHLAAAPRREPRHPPGGRRRRTASPTARPSASSRAAARSRCPIRIDPVAAPRPDVHDPALPGRRRGQPADDRRNGPEVRHGRVQGDGHPHREARGRRGHSPRVVTRTTDGLLVLGPGEGDAFPTMDVVRKSTAADGDGRWGVVVVTGVPGEGGTTHRHLGEAEGFWIVDGEVEFLGASSLTPMSAGSFALVPPGTEHGIRIVGDAAASWLAIWPALLDGFPEELERLSAAGASPTELAILRRHHGIEAGRRR